MRPFDPPLKINKLSQYVIQETVNIDNESTFHKCTSF